MLFHTLDFAVFLPIVFFLYWFVFHRNLNHQNILIILASYVFYGWWDWRFLGLLFLSSSVDFYLGLRIGQASSAARRKQLLALSLILNLGLLGYFKYFNFFIDSFADAFSLIGYKLSASHLHIVLPVGISFYTFQSISYCFDVYRGQIKPTREIIPYLAYVSFFPQLVAGPIERATNLIPQFISRRVFDYGQAVDGLRQILWGLFKKVVIADTCAVFVNATFANSTGLSGSTLLLAAIFFGFQIYGDFSGYSDIAIGTGRLFGFSLMRNFAFPYFSRDIAEFWRRWHISLTTWFRDYLYVPLGGSWGSKWQTVRNTFIIFLVSGFWHGANWTFIAWGVLHALFFLPLLLMDTNRKNIGTVAEGRSFPSIYDALRIMLTFLLVTLAWVFFRAESVKQAVQVLTSIFSPSLFSIPALTTGVLQTTILLLLFLIMEWRGRSEQYAIASFWLSWVRPLRWGMYLLLGGLIVVYGGGAQEFIYFQF